MFFLDFFFGVAEKHPLPDNLEAYDGLFAYAVGSKPLKNRLWAQYDTLGQVLKHELAIAKGDFPDRHRPGDVSSLYQHQRSLIMSVKPAD